MERKAAFGVTAGTVFIAGFLVLWRNGLTYSKGPIDIMAFVFFLLLLTWFLRPRRDKSASNQGVDKGLAFRIGKALHGILRPRKS